MKSTVLVIIPACILYIGYAMFLFMDIKKRKVRYLSKWVWMLIGLLSVPLGAIAYFLIGRLETGEQDEETTRTFWSDH